MEDQVKKPMTVRKAALFSLPFLTCISVLVLWRYSVYPYYKAVQQQKFLLVREKAEREARFVQNWMQTLDDEADEYSARMRNRTPPLFRRAEIRAVAQNPKPETGGAVTGGVQAERHRKDGPSPELNVQHLPGSDPQGLPATELDQEQAQPELDQQTELESVLHQEDSPVDAEPFDEATTLKENPEDLPLILSAELAVGSGQNISTEQAEAAGGMKLHPAPEDEQDVAIRVVSRHHARQLLSEVTVQDKIWSAVKSIIPKQLAQIPSSMFVRMLGGYEAATVATLSATASQAHTRQVVVFVQLDSTKEAVDNLRFFLKYGTSVNQHTSFIFLLQPAEAQRLGHDLPNLPKNSAILPPSGQCLWGTVGKVMIHVLERQPEIQRFAMLTSSVRGPFYPAASQNGCGAITDVLQSMLLLFFIFLSKDEEEGVQ
ncbi:hypothetical protein WJX74_007361 [Apatococcus lobatus]|uniref:Uncharacterized protein n=1 Tax=Apatococcus lobatus TaxID=904363 RepID=A0AAW1SBF1_9CHLO